MRFVSTSAKPDAAAGLASTFVVGDTSTPVFIGPKPVTVPEGYADDSGAAVSTVTTPEEFAGTGEVNTESGLVSMIAALSMLVTESVVGKTGGGSGEDVDACADSVLDACCDSRSWKYWSSTLSELAVLELVEPVVYVASL